MIQILLIYTAAFFMAGCSTLATTAAPKKPVYNYKADMAISIGDKSYDGVAVTQLSSPLKFTITSKAKLDVLIVSTCQRYDKFEKLDKNFFGGVGKTHTYTYQPTSIENMSRCSIFLQAFDKSGLTDWGYIAFIGPGQLEATSECSGQSVRSKGHSICQSKAGLEQSLTFDRAIPYLSGDASCNIVRKSPSAFTYRPSQGFCNAEFSDGKDFHSLTALGFDEVFIRGE